MFTLLQQEKNARRGCLTTARGAIETPVFMNVATQAAIKGGLSALDLAEIGCQVALCNTYHLHLRPGEDIVKAQGGLHGFMRWPHPILTDSGGFQVYSLAKRRKIGEEGVVFASHIDGRKVVMRPEDSIRIQLALGADIIMAFDECTANPSTLEYARLSAERTARWLRRCKETWEDHGKGPLLFGINQGSTFEHLRVEHMRQIAELDLPGYAVGGLAVGEPAETMYHILDTVTPHMPQNKPRYLMGVGTPGNIIESVARGIDFFDCVMPARNARHGHLQTWQGRINLRNEKYKADGLPIDGQCPCPVCQRFSRAYIRHLLAAGELLALRLCVLHNLFFYNQLMAKIRQAIEQNRFAAFRAQYAERLDRRI